MPTVVVGCFVALAVLTALADRSHGGALGSLRSAVATVIGRKAASTTLQAVATGIVTVTAITFSVLLLAVQQTASSLSPVVFDQFVRRRSNQIFFGFFVGLELRWIEDDPAQAEQHWETIAVVYPDKDLERLLDVLYSVLVAAHESHQTSTAAAVVATYVTIIERTPDHKTRARILEDVERAQRLLTEFPTAPDLARICGRLAETTARFGLPTPGQRNGAADSEKGTDSVRRDADGAART